MGMPCYPSRHPGIYIVLTSSLVYFVLPFFGTLYFLFRVLLYSVLCVLVFLVSVNLVLHLCVFVHPALCTKCNLYIFCVFCTSSFVYLYTFFLCVVLYSLFCVLCTPFYVYYVLPVLCIMYIIFLCTLYTCS